MKRIDSFVIILLFLSIGFSCENTSRDKIHEQVVEEERADPQDMLGQDNGEYAQEFEVVAENMRYNPSEIRVDAGRTVRIQLINRGDEEHNIEVELPTGERVLENNLKPGEQGVLEFTAPAEGGTYTIYCPVDDHKEQGMTAQLIVE